MMWERLFVLEPLAELRPDLVGPDGRPIGDHVRALKTSQEAPLARLVGALTAGPHLRGASRTRARAGPLLPSVRAGRRTCAHTRASHACAWVRRSPHRLCEPHRPPPAARPSSRRPGTPRPARTPAPGPVGRARTDLDVRRQHRRDQQPDRRQARSAARPAAPAGGRATRLAWRSAAPTERRDCRTIIARASSSQPEHDRLDARTGGGEMSGPISGSRQAATGPPPSTDRQDHEDAAHHAQSQERPEPAAAGRPERRRAARAGRSRSRMPPARKLYATNCPSACQRQHAAAPPASSSTTAGELARVDRLITISATTFIQPAPSRSARHGRSPASGTSPNIATAVGSSPSTQRRQVERHAPAAASSIRRCAPPRRSPEHPGQQRRLHQPEQPRREGHQRQRRGRRPPGRCPARSARRIVRSGSIWMRRSPAAGAGTTIRAPSPPQRCAIRSPSA